MLLGTISGKVTTKHFSFQVKNKVKNFEYVKVFHQTYEYVLCQVVELTVSTTGTIASCNILGYSDDGVLKSLRIPFAIGSEVFLADDSFIKSLLMHTSKGAYIGKLEGRDISLYLDLRKMLTTHVSVLAKSGAGKSYSVGVLLEEILEHDVPVLIIDPHGEHHSLKEPAQPDEEEKLRMTLFGVSPKGYPVTEYGLAESGAKPLKLSNKLTRSELLHMLPKLNTAQQGLLYQAIRNSEHTDFDELLLALESEESGMKWSLINLVEGLRNSDLFSSEETPPTELIQPGHASIISLKGYSPEIQELIVYKLASDLFTLRKENKIAPFFLVVEEAHNFCPERSFGEAASSKILRTIASEGRKFGLGLCIISQRPARVDKSVLSQCSSQMILKITNPHDLKAVGNSVEGITAETEQEIKNLSIGTALVTGATDLPLLVSVRPRRTAHGGVAVDVFANEEHKTPAEDTYASLLPVLVPTITPKDLLLMYEDVKEIVTTLRPLGRFTCTKDGKTYIIVVDLVRNEILMDLQGKTKKLPLLENLSKPERVFLRKLFSQKAIPVVKSDSSFTAQKLVASGYVSLKNNTYILNSAIFYKKLHLAALPTKLSYEHIAAKKISAKYTLKEAQDLLNKFTTVTDVQECWLVHHAVKKN